MVCKHSPLLKLSFFLGLTPIFSFLVSEVYCHTIQLCYLIFNPCPVAQVVIHFHSHIKMSVSHDVLQYLDVHTALCHSCAGCVSHNMSGNLWKQFCFPVFFLCPLDFLFVISVHNVIQYTAYTIGHKHFFNLFRVDRQGKPKKFGFLRLWVLLLQSAHAFLPCFITSFLVNASCMTA